MTIISWNLNGLMATIKNGAFAPFKDSAPDVLCLQEIRTMQEPVILDGYTHYWHHGDKEGYSGTALLLKQAPIRVIQGLEPYFPDSEGRALTAELPECYVVNAYVPNSQKNFQRSQYRMEWDMAFREFVCELDEDKPVIICGDFNVAREEIDIYAENERQYWAEQGYTSDERSNLETLIESGFVDAFRELHPGVGSYTWWSNRLKKREENRGWRLDYFFVSQRLMENVSKAEHLHSIHGSDHCPIELEVQLEH